MAVSSPTMEAPAKEGRAEAMSSTPVPSSAMKSLTCASLSRPGKRSGSASRWRCRVCVISGSWAANWPSWRNSTGARPSSISSIQAMKPMKTALTATRCPTPRLSSQRTGPSSRKAITTAAITGATMPATKTMAASASSSTQVRISTCGSEKVR